MSETSRVPIHSMTEHPVGHGIVSGHVGWGRINVELWTLPVCEYVDDRLPDVEV